MITRRGLLKLTAMLIPGVGLLAEHPEPAKECCCGCDVSVPGSITCTISTENDAQCFIIEDGFWRKPAKGAWEITYLEA